MEVKGHILRIKPELWPFNKKELIIEAPLEGWGVIGHSRMRTVFKLKFRKIPCATAPRGYNILMNFHEDKTHSGDLWLDDIGNACYRAERDKRYILIKEGCHFNEEKMLILNEQETRAYFPYYDVQRDSIGWREYILPNDPFYKKPKKRGKLGCPGKTEGKVTEPEPAPPLTPEERERSKEIERAREGLKKVKKFKEPEKATLFQRILRMLTELFKRLLKR